ncbi:hypothetical protein A2U01_0110730, partial [Trifolium medium]|nr:hypothetical protein [Trifolium medium]
TMMKEKRDEQRGKLRKEMKGQQAETSDGGGRVGLRRPRRRVLSKKIHEEE